MLCYWQTGGAAISFRRINGQIPKASASANSLALDVLKSWDQKRHYFVI